MSNSHLFRLSIYRSFVKPIYNNIKIQTGCLLHKSVDNCELIHLSSMIFTQRYNDSGTTVTFPIPALVQDRVICPVQVPTIAGTWIGQRALSCTFPRTGNVTFVPVWFNDMFFILVLCNIILHMPPHLWAHKEMLIECFSIETLISIFIMSAIHLELPSSCSQKCSEFTFCDILWLWWPITSKFRQVHFPAIVPQALIKRPVYLNPVKYSRSARKSFYCMYCSASKLWLVLLYPTPEILLSYSHPLICALGELWLVYAQISVMHCCKGVLISKAWWHWVQT